MPDARRPGRPPLSPDEQSVSVCLTLTESRYNEIYDRARRESVSVPEAIRRQLDAEKKYPK
jgi:hypothetical protein